ncbi:beta strand repeat-containing protein [Undibacterium sp. Di27W]|uniref:beta strand repeat-containing protein n=1 Tax=Undibacterium sp. Di27W TaxID=3413036 RepID=UPI003BF0FC47
MAVSNTAFSNNSGVIMPSGAAAAATSISAAIYDADKGILTVSGNTIAAGDHIDLSKFSFTGEAGNTYQLTTTSISTVTANTFSVTLNAADKLNLNGLLDVNGSVAVSGHSYNLLAMAGWDSSSAAPTDFSNPVSVNDVLAPIITSATYNAITHKLSVTGAHLVKVAGADNDINVSKLELGPWTNLKPLTSNNVELTDVNHFEVTLSESDVNTLATVIDHDHSHASTSIFYRIWGSDNWNGVVTGGDTLTYTQSGDVQVSGVPVTLSNVNYFASAGSFRITSANLYDFNTFDMSKIKFDHFTLKGQEGTTYTLSGAITNGWVDSGNTLAFTVSEADRISLNGILNQNGAGAVDGSSYSFSATPGWYVDGNTQASSQSTVTTVSVTSPVINSANYNATTHVLSVSGSSLVKTVGANNDVIVSKLSIVGEGGINHSLSATGNVEIIDESHFSVTLSDTDANAVNVLVNKNGSTASSGLSYNLVAADDWNSVVTGGNTADLNSYLSVTGVSTSINGASYNASTGVLTVTGNGITAGDHIDPGKLSFTGEGGNSYQLTSAPVLATTGGFSITLNAGDQLNLNGLLDKNGNAAVSGLNFNMSAASGWDVSTATAADVSNTVTVSGVVAPVITSATYDAITHKLSVTGDHLVKVPGMNNDIDVSKLSLGPWTNLKKLTSGGVELRDANHFDVILSDADAASLATVIDHDHDSAASSIFYRIWGEDDWNGVVTGTNIRSYTQAGDVQVSGVPAIVSNIAYHASGSYFSMTSTNLWNFESFDMSKIKFDHFTLKGQNGASYTLSGAITGGWVDSGSTLTFSISDSERTTLNGILDQNGTMAVDGTGYTFIATPGWYVDGNTQAPIQTTARVDSLLSPTISSATYNASSHVLSVSGASLVKTAGANNDITVSKLSVIGEGGVSRTLAATGNVEITDENHFSITLADADTIALNTLLNKNGNTSLGGVSYNLVASDDWDSVVTGSNTADLTGNSINVSGHANAAPVISHLPGNVTIEDLKSLFAGVSVTDTDSASATVSVKLANPAAGRIIELESSGGHYDTQTGIYQISGSMGNLEAALHNLAFIPMKGHFSSGSNEDMVIELRITDSDNGSNVYNSTHVISEPNIEYVGLVGSSVHTTHNIA